MSAGGDLFLIHTATGKWDQLTKTPVPELDAKLSPDASAVAFRRGWDLYTVDTATRKETRLTKDGTETLRNGIPDWVYPEELTLGTGFWWSPDSKSICYLQFDSSREPVFPHADMLGTRAFCRARALPAGRREQSRCPPRHHPRHRRRHASGSRSATPATPT